VALRGRSSRPGNSLVGSDGRTMPPSAAQRLPVGDSPRSWCSIPRIQGRIATSAEWAREHLGRVPGVAPSRLTRGSLNLGGIARTFGTGVPDQGVPRARPVTKGATISDVVFCPDLTLEAP